MHLCVCEGTTFSHNVTSMQRAFLIHTTGIQALRVQMCSTAVLDIGRDGGESSEPSCTITSSYNYQT